MATWIITFPVTQWALKRFCYRKITKVQSLTLCESVWAWLGEWGGWEAGRDNGGEGAGASRRGGGGAPRGLLGVDGRELLGVAKQVVDCDSLCCTIFWHAETIQNHPSNWMFYKTSRITLQTDSGFKQQYFKIYKQTLLNKNKTTKMLLEQRCYISIIWI